MRINKRGIGPRKLTAPLAGAIHSVLPPDVSIQPSRLQTHSTFFFSGEYLERTGRWVDGHNLKSVGQHWVGEETAKLTDTHLLLVVEREDKERSKNLCLQQ